VTSSGVAASFAGGGAPSTRGIGSGPAEISPSYALSLNTTIYKNILTGGNGYEGRYGKQNVPGTSGTLGAVMSNKWFEYGQDYWTFANVNNAGSYGSPPDPFGVGVLGLDRAGRPVYAGVMSGTKYYGFGSGITNNPYELDLGPNAVKGCRRRR